MTILSFPSRTEYVVADNLNTGLGWADIVSVENAAPVPLVVLFKAENTDRSPGNKLQSRFTLRDGQEIICPHRRNTIIQIQRSTVNGRDAKVSDLGPIRGVKDAPTLDLAAAVAHDPELATEKLDSEVFLSLQHAQRCVDGGAATNPHNLTLDEAASITLYTLESPLYQLENARLRNADRNKLKPLFEKWRSVQFRKQMSQ